MLDDDGIDWNELIAELEADVKAERFTPISTSTNPADTLVALQQYFDEILEQVLHGAASGDQTTRP